MGIPSGWHYDTPGGGWESEWNDAQSRGAVGSGGDVTFYRSAKGSEFALDYATDTGVAGWGSNGIPPQFQQLLASAGSRQRGLLHGRNIYQPPAAPPPEEPKEPVVEAKPVERFDPNKYSTISTEQKPSGYTLNTEATAYKDWLSRNQPGSRNSSSGSGEGSDPTIGGNGGGDRVSFYQSKIEQGEPSSAAAARYSESTGSGGSGSGSGSGSSGGRQRMAGGRQFQERLNRYRR